ncbi:hypothetical protein DVH26_07790 [Paenibacillus sp. H1-7]|uniref:hypothetical protein n=1 Tax=Paenibacillus sp. H1-7 TaxID=2282849 RepID=UPI001EF922EE|nr:hypothetical protein [Paenibacillus sp. H1-7]ULL14359.1 hypothetical protein DVH26_07790 [Paenibacillus sp. H1-7]
MPVVKLPSMDDVQYNGNIQQAFDNIVNGVERIRKTQEWLMNGNVNFQNIQANGITAKNISANSIETDALVAGAVTADKISVEELSAITADLGHITAGLIESIEIISSTIIGSEIMTRNFGLYPRAQMSSTQNMFTAEASSNEYIRLVSDYLGQVSLLISSNSMFGQIRPFGNMMFINTSSGSGGIQISSGGDLELYADILDSSAFVVTNKWSRFYSDGDNETLQDALDRLQNQINNHESRIRDLEP